MKRIAVFGASGAIGAALVTELALRFSEAEIFAFSRTETVFASDRVHGMTLDYLNEAQLSATAKQIAPLDMIVVATGILHDEQAKPEKSIRDFTVDQFMHLYQVNTVVPAMIAKAFIPVLSKDKQVIFAALSARIGSISDNRLGGWYAYRASKAALNMLLKTLSIELSRSNKQSIVVGLHPGTVDSSLSKPFQASVPAGNLFTPEDSAKQLIDVLTHLTPKQSGKCFAFDGEEITP